MHSQKTRTSLQDGVSDIHQKLACRSKQPECENVADNTRGDIVSINQITSGNPSFIQWVLDSLNKKEFKDWKTHLFVADMLGLKKQDLFTIIAAVLIQRPDKIQILQSVGVDSILALEDRVRISDIVILYGPKTNIWPLIRINIS